MPPIEAEYAIVRNNALAKGATVIFSSFAAIATTLGTMVKAVAVFAYPNGIQTGKRQIMG